MNGGDVDKQTDIPVGHPTRTHTQSGSFKHTVPRNVFTQDMRANGRDIIFLGRKKILIDVVGIFRLNPKEHRSSGRRMPTIYWNYLIFFLFHISRPE